MREQEAGVIVCSFPGFYNITLTFQNNVYISGLPSDSMIANIEPSLFSSLSSLSNFFLTLTSMSLLSFFLQFTSNQASNSWRAWWLSLLVNSTEFCSKRHQLSSHQSRDSSKLQFQGLWCPPLTFFGSTSVWCMDIYSKTSMNIKKKASNIL